jgi:hypothetical protein
VTGYATSCGQKQLLKAQAVRLAIATGIWYNHLSKSYQQPLGVTEQHLEL